jgi:uncharacterized protein (TIGR02391 family)
MASDASVQQLNGEAIERLAQIIGDHYTGSEITRLLHRCGHTDISHDGGTKWRFVATVFDGLQRRDRSPNVVLAIVKRAGAPEGWIGRREQFDGFLGTANAVLEFYGVKLTEEGKLLRTGRAATTVARGKSEDQTSFDERKFHASILKHSRAHFYRGAYFHAVFEACKALDTSVRQATQSEKSGQPLMTEALSLNGKVKMNSQRSGSERDEQQGVMYLCMGLMSAVRNPQAHEPELHWPMSREDALDVLAVISFLFRKLEGAMVVSSGSATQMQLV